ncbi:MAG: cardiolipin synthase ClsB [Elusimicrobia bacterium]|nr:cardiolipin synthase ClsB [Elusimicrobiota bacterium]
MAFQGLRNLLRRSPAGSGLLAKNPDLYVPGNEVRLLEDGEATFQAMLAAIEGARQSVNLETYAFQGGKVGHDFASRLMAKARQGIPVRVILDAVGSLHTSPFFLGRMADAGVQVLDYHPVAPWRRRWAWGRRDHRKILVVDGKTAFTGGVNISDEHLPLSRGGEGWRDCHVKVDGPAAFELERVFRMTWFKETRAWFHSPGHPEHKPGSARVWIAANQEFINRFRIRSSYLHVLRAAQREVTIANAYFIPDLGIRRALAAAVRRGVSVRILVPGRSDVPAVWYASRRRYDLLLRRGIRIFEWKGPMLHSKAVVVDRRWCSVGSYNLDHRSLLHNLEVNLHAADPVLAGDLAARLDSDIALSAEITLDSWRERPLTDKAVERALYLFRYFF